MSRTENAELTAVTQHFGFSREQKKVFLKSYRKTIDALRVGIDSDSFAALSKSLNEIIDKNVAKADLEKADCKKGCGYCCGDTIHIHFAELWSIFTYLNNHFSAAELEKIWEWIAARNELSKDTKTSKGIYFRCPFLDQQDSCSIYEVRPGICRTFYSTNVMECKRMTGQLFGIPKIFKAILEEPIDMLHAVDKGYEFALEQFNIPAIPNFTMEKGLLFARRMQAENKNSLIEWLRAFFAKDEDVITE